GDDVGGGARPEGHDHADGPGGIVLRSRGQRHGEDGAGQCGQDGTAHRHLLVSFCGRRGCQPWASSSLCSPSRGGAVTSSGRSPSNETGERTVRKVPTTGCSASTNSCRCRAWASSGTSAVVYIGEYGTSSASRRRHHSARSRCRKIGVSTPISASWFS